MTEVAIRFAANAKPFGENAIDLDHLWFPANQIPSIGDQVFMEDVRHPELDINGQAFTVLVKRFNTDGNQLVNIELTLGLGKS